MQKTDWAALGQETTQTLSELIQIDTTNPPGNEYKAIEYLREKLAHEGIASEIFEKEQGRSNLVARLKGQRPGKKLLLLSHVDVVPAPDPKKWKYPPFSGAIAEGYVWGRGALDMKNITATHYTIFTLFKRLNIDFAGELIFAATADEEKGSTYGAAWLAHMHPETLRADWCLTEGGGMPLQIASKTFYTIESVEKGLWWFKVRVKGTSGHGSLPHPDNALTKAAYIIDRVSNYKFPKQIAPAVREFILKAGEALGPEIKKIALVLLDESQELDLSMLPKDSPISATLLNALVRTTISPTMIHAGVKENVIPDSCEFVLDCRLVPGYTQQKVRETLLELADRYKNDIEIETIQQHDVSESPIDDPFYKLIERTVKEELPSVETIPIMLTGATDSRFVRGLGVKSYGFCPLSTKMSLADREKLIHNDNERVDLESLELGVRVLSKIALKALEARL
ncbi:MAG: M20/M25/M40 family metallo-hydrolase [Candidatus Bipolaricaulota bacterium]|nr:M20/M25/M40 family metallo-hydrolase [Candidatus Bipolaricaulota bacterium]